MSDAQDKAEALDDAVVGPGDDRTGERTAEPPDFPPDEPVGADAVGTTPVEEDGGESFAQRDAQHRPDTNAEGTDVGTDRSAARPELSAEEAALHVEQPDRASPMRPHPQARADRAVDGATEDDTPVERYRDSPGLAAAGESERIPEPNEPG